MPNRIPSALATHTPGLATPDRRGMFFCLVLLVAASASSSLMFACATPFAAFAVVAAAMLPLRPAIIVVAAAWATNQLVGFGPLGYPRTIDAVTWGMVIGAATICATIVSSLLFNRWAAVGRLTLYPIACVASYAIYELGLGAAIPVLGGADAFTVAIIGRIALVNLVWLIGLVGVCESRRHFVGDRSVFRRREA